MLAIAIAKSDFLGILYFLELFIFAYFLTKKQVGKLKIHKPDFLDNKNH